LLELGLRRRASILLRAKARILVGAYTVGAYAAAKAPLFHWFACGWVVGAIELQHKIEIEESKATDKSVRSIRALFHTNFVPHRLRSTHAGARNTASHRDYDWPLLSSGIAYTKHGDAASYNRCI
jgi:hypothetical protein